MAQVAKPVAKKKGLERQEPMASFPSVAVQEGLHMKPLRLLLCTGAALSALTLQAAAADFTFTIHHFLSPKAPAQTKLIEPWAKRIEEQSNGRITFEIFPSMSLGGKPPELYKQVRDGSADIVWTLPEGTAY